MATGNTNSLHLLLEQEVIANPTLAGTEDELTGLQVDGTKYKVGGSSGGKLYKHRLKFSCYYNSSSKFYAYMYIISSSSSALQANVIKNYVDQTNGTFMYRSNFNNGCSIINIYFEWSNNAIRGDILITEYDFVNNTTSIITKNREAITFTDDDISEI